jgi:hypothetical protein
MAKETNVDKFARFVDTVREEPKRERIVTRGFSKEKMERDPDVKEKFSRYATAVVKFNASRIENMESKYDLQEALDLILYESKKIKERKMWDCGIDKDDGHFWYKDDPKSYVERKKDFERQIGSKTAFDDADVFFTNEPRSTSADASGGSSGGTPKGVLAKVKAEKDAAAASKFKPIATATDRELQHWYELNAKGGLPQDWQQRPAVELNPGGVARAVQHKWKPEAA